MSNTFNTRKKAMCAGGRQAFLLALLFTAFMGSIAAGAQALYGTLTGTVTDSSGAAVPEATVTVRNQGNGETRTVKTNASGEYLVRNLEAGPYTVEVPAAGSFGGFRQQNVALTVNQEVRVNASLKPAGVNSEVTVTTAQPTLQTETAEVNHQISDAEITELPVSGSQGRNFQSLYTLIPGATAVGETNSIGGNPARAQSLNVNGVESMSNTTRIDGAVNTYGWLPYLIAYVPPADAIQTVNITTNSFNAEQGVAGGAAINVAIKTGTNHFHGSVWEYNQIFNTNARSYTATTANVPRLPKNIFNQFGFSIGGPVYIPKLLRGKDKLFFFQDFERTTRRQLLTGFQTVPDAKMITGDFSEVTSQALLYDPQPGGSYQAAGTNGYLLPANRTVTFLQEYGSNAIPAARLSPQAAKMLALLQPISNAVGTPSATQLGSFLTNDYFASNTFSYNRNTSDSKITYNPSDRTSIFGRYSVQPFSALEPQPLGAAGGAPLDGGQPGINGGRIQNVGLGFSHVITPSLVLDADAGYTRQVSGAQSALDIADGNFGLNTLGIPGTNSPGSNIDYFGQPIFSFGFTNLGNSATANPFKFRDNQFTADVNLSYNKGKHATKYGFTYYHFDLNHFQPSSGAGVTNPRGGFTFNGTMTYSTNANAKAATNAYYSLADYLLGLPTGVQKSQQISDPNALRWSEFGVYAQDQWNLNSKLTLNYGVRYEYYPVPYKDHSGIQRLDPTLPQTANIEIGGLGGNPQNAGVSVSKTLFVPRLGIAYRVNDKTVIRSGFGMTTDPDSMRFLRDSYPTTSLVNYTAAQTGIPAVDPTQTSAQYSLGLPLTLAVGIPLIGTPTFPNGFTSLPVGQSTNTIPANYRRGYIESWNLYLQQDLGAHFVMNVGYVGTHQVRQLFGRSLNAAPLPSGSTICMANGQYNPNSKYYTGVGNASNACSFSANELINLSNCATSSSPTCYNTGGVTINEPSQSSNYNGLQSELTRNAGRLAQFGLIYTWSHAFAYAENGAGSGSTGAAFSYPDYIRLNRATASYDRTNNIQFYTIYRSPFGKGQSFASNKVVNALLGGFQINAQISHTSGSPFSVSPSSCTINAPFGATCYADLVAPYHQLGGHNRTPGDSTITGGQPWFDPTAFANPVEPNYGSAQAGLLPSQIVAPHLGNTHRNQFRGPGYTGVNGSLVRSFHIFRESEFQVRVEGFNLLNHPQFANPNATITPTGGNFGYITSFSNSRILQYSGRFNF